MEAIETEVPELEAKKIELESRVEKEESALDAMMESLKGEMAKIGAELDAAQRELQPWEGKIGDAKARPRPSFTRANRGFSLSVLFSLLPPLFILKNIIFSTTSVLSSLQLMRMSECVCEWYIGRPCAEARVDVATTERDLMVERKEEAKRKLSEARAGAEAADVLVATKSEEIADAESTLESERERATERREAEAAAREQEQKANETTREIRGRLEQRRSAADQERSKGVIVQALMAAKTKGKIKGVLGRLGDLGAIDKKYDVAVSTACAALDYIVVETTADAQACVAHLRANNLGVATFLILEKQQGLEGRMRESAKAAAAEKGANSAPRLIDLIKPAEPRLAVAFYYGVRDTAVADDLDAASKIAYEGRQRRRVVTLAGQLIETSGTMSGGGNKPKGGRMRTGTAAPVVGMDAEESAAAVAEAERELSTASVTYEEARAAANSAGRDAKEAEAAVSKIERALPKLRAEVAAAEARAADLRGRLGELEAAAKTSKEDAAELKKLEKEVVDATEAFERVQADAAGIRERCEKLQAEMDNVGGEKLKKQRALVKVRFTGRPLTSLNPHTVDPPPSLVRFNPLTTNVYRVLYDQTVKPVVLNRSTNV